MFSQAAAALRTGVVSSESLVAAAISRAKESSAAGINCFVSITDDALALTAARQSDQRRATGASLGPLDGIPFSVKDNFCVSGSATTAASAILKGFTAPYTAPCVQQLLDNGAIMIGKTNMDEFGMGSSTAFRSAQRFATDSHCPSPCWSSPNV